MRVVGAALAHHQEVAGRGGAAGIAELDDAWQELDKSAPPCPTRIHDSASNHVPPAQPSVVQNGTG